jgi:hypothetical protein
MPQRCVLYYHLTWLTSPPIWWDSFGVVFFHQMMNEVSHKFRPASMDIALLISVRHTIAWVIIVLRS